MKALNTVSTLACLALLSTYSVNGFAKTGNGDSYSGPTLAPNAIAMSMDKPISELQLYKVLTGCFAPSAENNFLADFIKPLLPNAQHDQIDDYNFRGEAKSENGNLSLQFYDSFLFVQKQNIARFQMEIKPNGVLWINEYPGSSIKAKRVFSVAHFPVFKSKITIIDSYDPISGDYIGKIKKLNNLQVIYNFREEPAYVKARNITTNLGDQGAPTELMAPVADYTNCVIEELGKL